MICNADAGIWRRLAGRERVPQTVYPVPPKDYYAYDELNSDVEEYVYVPGTR